MAGKGGEVINDFLIEPKDAETGMRYRGRHFQIEYSLEEDAYFIKDFGMGQGAFVKLDKPLELQNNHLINIGNAFIIVNFITGKHKLNSSTGGLSASTYEHSAGRKEDKENANPQLSMSKASSCKTELPQLRLKIFG